MGSSCATEEKVKYGEMSEARSNMEKRQHTLLGIDSEEVFDFYDVGCGISSVAYSVFSYGANETAEEKQDAMDLSNKHKRPFYILSTIANICIADGILHEKEEKFIRQLAVSRGVPKNDIEELLKGKDYTKEMLESFSIVYDEELKIKKAKAKAKAEAEAKAEESKENEKGKKEKKKEKKEKEKSIEGFKKYFILLSILAATQDGLVRDEYEQSIKIANEMGLKRKDVEKMVELVRTEFAMAKQLKLYLNP